MEDIKTKGINVNKIKSNDNNFIRILKGTGIALGITFVILVIFSALLTYTDLNEKYMNMTIISTSGMSILISSFIINRKMRKNGMINGATMGALYYMILYLISSILNWNFSLNMQSIIMLIVGMMLGIVGGVIGVNKQVKGRQIV